MTAQTVTVDWAEPISDDEHEFSHLYAYVANGEITYIGRPVPDSPPPAIEDGDKVITAYLSAQKGRRITPKLVHEVEHLLISSIQPSRNREFCTKCKPRAGLRVRCIGDYSTNLDT